MTYSSINFTRKLSFVFVVTLLTAPGNHIASAMEGNEESPPGISLALSPRNQVAEQECPLDVLNSKTKEWFENNPNQKAFRQRGLEEALMLVEYREQREDLSTLPSKFVDQQIGGALEYIKANYDSFKHSLALQIVSDASFPTPGNQVDRNVYNYTAARLMAVACLGLKEDEMMTKEDILTCFTQVSSKKSFSKWATFKSFSNATYLKENFDYPWNRTNKEGQGLYSVLVDINFENIQSYDQNYCSNLFLHCLLPKDDAVIILGENPFFGTQTIPYTLLNELHFMAGSLKLEVSAHGISEYEGPFGVFKHDDDHRSAFVLAITSLKNSNLYVPTMAILRKIYTIALEQADIKKQAALFDFIFILMHEESPLNRVAKLPETLVTVTKQDIFNEFAAHSLPPGPPFKEVRRLIAQHGYSFDQIEDVVENLSTNSRIFKQYWMDMLQILKDHGLY